MNDADLKARIADYCNGTLNAAEFESLQDDLRESPEARAYFRHYMNLDAALSDAAAAENADLNAWTAPAKARKLATRTSPLVWVPAAAAAVMAIGLFLFWKNQPPPPPATAQTNEPKSAGFAILTRLIDAEWQDGSSTHRAGDALSAGHLRLKSGVAQIEFFGGATVLLEGEADFEIVSAQRARCHHGRLRAQVPPAARGFTIVTPETEVVDLGTEIGIAVGPNGASEVHVFDGEVELHGNNGAAAKSLKGGEAVAFGNGQPQNLMAADGNAFAKLAKFEPQSEREQRARFERWKAHSLKLRQDPRLIVYYPCDQTDSWERRVRNEAGDPERRGAMVGVTRSTGRWPWKGAVEFRRPGDRVRLFIPGEYNSLTLACWVRLDSVDRMWNSLYLTDAYEPGEVHWQITEGKLTYSMRVDGARGNHLYQSPVFWEPKLSGQWIHLATTFDAEKAEVVHYLNGREMSRETSTPKQAVQTTRFGAGEVGNWGEYLKRQDPEFVVRSLNGLMDEFAIFSAALSAEEISEMARLGNPAAP